MKSIQKVHQQRWLEKVTHLSGCFDTGCLVRSGYFLFRQNKAKQSLSPLLFRCFQSSYPSLDAFSWLCKENKQEKALSSVSISLNGSTNINAVNGYPSVLRSYLHSAARD